MYVYSPLPPSEFGSPEKNEEFQILMYCKEADVVWLKLYVSRVFQTLIGDTFLSFLVIDEK